MCHMRTGGLEAEFFFGHVPPSAAFVVLTGLHEGQKAPWAVLCLSVPGLFGPCLKHPANGAVYDRHQLLQPVFKPFFEKLGYKWDVADSSLQFSVALHSVAMAEVEGGEPQDPGKK